MVCQEEAGRREDGPLTISVATGMEECRTKEGEAQTDMVNIFFSSPSLCDVLPYQ